MSDMTVSEAVAIADRALAYFLDDDEDLRAAVRVLVDNARAAAPEGGDLAQRVRDAITLMGQQNDETLDYDLYRVLVEILTPAPSVAALPREDGCRGSENCDSPDHGHVPWSIARRGGGL
jgi:hypothetical protein